MRDFGNERPDDPDGGCHMNSASASKPEMGEEAREFRVVVCRSGHRWFGLEVGDVMEVVRMVAIAPIADAPPSVAGLIDYRGIVTPVIDLATRMGTGPRYDDLNARIVICLWENGPFGLIVDEVDEVAGISSRSVETSEAISERTNLVAGAVRVNDRIVLMLEMSTLAGDLLGLNDANAGASEGDSWVPHNE